MTGRSASRLVLVMVLWAGCYPLIAIGIQSAPHYLFAALRASIAGGALLLAALALGRPMPRAAQAWASLSAIGLGSTTLGFIGMFHAAALVSPGIATVVASTQPLIAALLVSRFPGERAKGIQGIGLVLGFAGIALIALPAVRAGEGASWTGLGWIALAAAGVAWSNVLLRRMANHVDPAAAMGIQLLLGAIPLWGLALIAGPLEISWNRDFVASLLALSLLGTSLAFWLWQQALIEVTVNTANGFNFLTPVIGLIAGRLWFHESLSPAQAAGASLAISAPLLTALFWKNERPPG